MMGSMSKRHQDKGVDHIRKVRAFVRDNIRDVQTVLDSQIMPEYLGAVFYDEYHQLSEIKRKVALHLIDYFKSVFTYPLIVETEWIYVKTLNDRVVDIGVTDKIVNALIRAQHVETLQPGTFIRFVDRSDKRRADTVMKVVESVGGMEAERDMVFVEPVNGEHAGSLGKVNAFAVEPVPEDEML